MKSSSTFSGRGSNLFIGAPAGCSLFNRHFAGKKPCTVRLSAPFNDPLSGNQGCCTGYRHPKGQRVTISGRLPGASKVKYQGNNPKHRIAKRGYFNEWELGGMASTVRHQGSAHHKTRPADYDFKPPTAPRPLKLISDGRHVVSRDEAQLSLENGIRLGMVSSHLAGGWSKYVWAVDDSGAHALKRWNAPLREDLGGTGA